MTDRKFLSGENIYLRGLESKDIAGNYLHWFDDEEVCRNNSHHRFPMSEAKAMEYISKVNDSNANLVLAIIEKNNSTHIGNISLQNINYFNRSAEFAIIIGEKDYWGKGYSKEAGRLIISHGFESLNLNRIYCGTTAENIAMQKLALFLGFKNEGLRRQAEFKNNMYLDVVEYGLLKNEWEKLNK